MKHPIKSLFRQAVACGFVFLFVYTALDKLRHLGRFRFALESSPWLAAMYRPLSVTIPLIELALVVLLTWPRTQRLGLLLSTTLLFSFTLYIGAMLAWAPALPCGCGGILNALSWKGHLLVNAALTALGAIATCQTKKSIELAVPIVTGHASPSPTGEAEHL